MMKPNPRKRRSTDGGSGSGPYAFQRFRLLKSVLVGTTLGVGGLLTAAGCMQMAQAQDVAEAPVDQDPVDNTDGNNEARSRGRTIAEVRGLRRNEPANGFGDSTPRPAMIGQRLRSTAPAANPGSTFESLPTVESTTMVPRPVTVEYWDADSGQLRSKTVTRYHVQTQRSAPFASTSTQRSKNDHEIASLVRDIMRTPPDADEDEKTKRDENLDRLKGLLGKEFDRMHEAQQTRIDELTERLKKLQETQDARQDARDEIVQRRVLQLTRQADPLAWDPNEAQSAYSVPGTNTFAPPAPAAVPTPRFPQGFSLNQGVPGLSSPPPAPTPGSSRYPNQRPPSLYGEATPDNRYQPRAGQNFSQPLSNLPSSGQGYFNQNSVPRPTGPSLGSSAPRMPDTRTPDTRTPDTRTPDPRMPDPRMPEQRFRRPSAARGLSGDASRLREGTRDQDARRPDQGNLPDLEETIPRADDDRPERSKEEDESRTDPTVDVSDINVVYEEVIGT